MPSKVIPKPAAPSANHPTMPEVEKKIDEKMAIFMKSIQQMFLVQGANINALFKSTEMLSDRF